MPRQARLDVPGSLQHITARGIEHGHIFLDDQDRQDFLARLKGLFCESQIYCYAWALLPDHFHLLLKTTQEPLSKVMRRLMTGYAVTFNKRHNRNGHLFQNRYKSTLCQEEAYLLELIRYIHLNPLRSRLVEDLPGLDRYPWSMHSVLLGHNPDPLEVGNGITPVLKLFDQEPRQGREVYRQFVAQGLRQGSRPEFQGGGLMRSSMGIKCPGGRQVSSDERVLGCSDFVETVLAKTENPPVRQGPQMSLEELIGLVSEWLELDREDLLSGSRKKAARTGRALISYVGSRHQGYRFTELGKALNIHPVNAARNADKGRDLFGPFKSHWAKAIGFPPARE